MRATRTKRLMEGEDIDLGTCLVINPAIEVLEDAASEPDFLGKLHRQSDPHR